MATKSYSLLNIPLATFTFYNGSAWAYIRMDALKTTAEGMKELSDAIAALGKLGFSYSYTSHTLGYYDAVEDVTMEFYHPNFAKPKNAIDV